LKGGLTIPILHTFWSQGKNNWSIFPPQQWRQGSKERSMTEEDEAFNEIERRSKAKKDAVESSVNAKEALTKLLTDSYDQGVKDGLDSVIQAIKELRPAIMPLEGMGRGKATQEWFDILVKAIEEMKK
jgi:hypothetical protein